MHSATHVASVRVPAAHDVVSCPDNVYPASHSGVHVAPDASSSPVHVPAEALSGNCIVHFVLSTGRHVAGVNIPSAEHEDLSLIHI